MDFLILYPSISWALVSFFVLLVRWFIRPRDRKRTEWMLAVTVVTIPAATIAWHFADFLSRLTPNKYDQFIYRFDTFLGQPSFLLGGLVHHSRLMFELAWVSYNLMPAMMAVTLGIYLWLRPQHDTIALAKTLLLNLFLAVPLYLIFPVCGPAFAFPGYPFERPDRLVPHPAAISAAPNGVPSVHTSTALLILWFLGEWWWGRVVGWAFLSLTIFATLGLGQHYFFDLLCAVPYAIAVYLLINSQPAILPMRSRLAEDGGGVSLLSPDRSGMKRTD